MKPVAVYYATREGQTQRIAEHIAKRLKSLGLAGDLRNVRFCPSLDNLSRYSAVILAASVHIGRHQREMVRFVRAHREQLDRVPTWFFSVSLSQVGAQRAGDPAEKHAQFVADVERMIIQFCKETAWRPKHSVPVAGALRYSRYNFIVRFIMKRIAAAQGPARIRLTITNTRIGPCSTALPTTSSRKSNLYQVHWPSRSCRSNDKEI